MWFELHCSVVRCFQFPFPDRVIPPLRLYRISSSCTVRKISASVLRTAFDPAMIPRRIAHGVVFHWPSLLVF